LDTQKLSLANSGLTTKKRTTQMLTVDFILGGWKLESSSIVVRGKEHPGLDPDSLRIKVFAPQHYSVFSRKLDRPPFSRGVPDEERLAAAKTFDAAGGRYTLSGNTLTEMIDYASFPNYEGKVMTFRLFFDGQRLIQEGIYPLKSLGLGDHDGYLLQSYSRVNL
jgi:hypothetical protein